MELGFELTKRKEDFHQRPLRGLKIPSAAPLIPIELKQEEKHCIRSTKIIQKKPWSSYIREVHLTRSYIFATSIFNAKEPCAFLEYFYGIFHWPIKTARLWWR